MQLLETTRLAFGPGDPVRAASAVTALGDGWLIAQDDTTHGAWWRRDGSVERVRLFPPLQGRDRFDEASGTKHLKPDLEAGCTVWWGDRPAALLLGSGSLPARMRAVLCREGEDGIELRTADLTPLYERVRTALGLEAAQLNLEGACVVDDRLRWFQRGHGRTGVASASIDVDLAALVAVVAGEAELATVTVGEVRRYDLGEVGGLPLAITDAVALPDGWVCVSAVAEDAPDAVADGPVAGSALALLDDEDVTVLPLPDGIGGAKIEGLALVGATPTEVRLLAVVDEDDPAVASLAVQLLLPWAPAPTSGAAGTRAGAPWWAIGAVVGLVVAAIVVLNLHILAGLEAGYAATPQEVWGHSPALAVLDIGLLVGGPALGAVLSGRSRRSRRRRTWRG